MGTSGASWEERMREAQRVGREDALSGRQPTHETFERESDWVANYTAGRLGSPAFFTPLPWAAEIALALTSAAGTELVERMRASYPLAPWARMAVMEIALPARRQRAKDLGLGPNDELPLLRASPIGLQLPLLFVLPIAGWAARRLGVRPALVTLLVYLSMSAASHASWRRAGLPTSPAGRYRPSAPA